MGSRVITPEEFLRRSGLVNEFGDPIEWVPEVHGPVAAALDDPEVRVLVVTSVRQSGKSTLAALLAMHAAFTKPSQRAVLVAASLDQASAIFTAKFRRPIELSPKLAPLAEFSARKVRIDATDSELEVISSNESTSTGRTLHLAILDEVRELGEECFTALLPSVRATGGKLLLTTTAGSRSHWLFRLIQESKGDPSVRVVEIHHDWNPSSRRKEFSALDALTFRLFENAARRELKNEWVDLDGQFLSGQAIDAVFDAGMTELSGSKRACFVGIDLSYNRDKTSIVVVEAEEESRLRVAALECHDPKDFEHGFIPPAFVVARLASVVRRFRIVDGLVDARAEVGAVMDSILRNGWRIRPVMATLASNMEAWGTLGEFILGGRLRSPPNERLRDELYNLRIEDVSGGRAWRVVDDRRKLHRDLTSALSLACAAAGKRVRLGVSFRDPAEAVEWIQRRNVDTFGPQDRTTWERRRDVVEAECDRLERACEALAAARRARETCTHR